MLEVQLDLFLWGFIMGLSILFFELKASFRSELKCASLQGSNDVSIISESLVAVISVRIVSQIHARGKSCNPGTDVF